MAVSRELMNLERRQAWSVIQRRKDELHEALLAALRGEPLDPDLAVIALSCLLGELAARESDSQSN